MLLPLMLMLGAQDADRVGTMVMSARDLTRADVPCEKPKDDNEIVVCSRREADRYRVPFVPAASAKTSVPLRTADLTRDYSQAACGQGAFMVHCGKVGATVTQSFGPGTGSGKFRVETERELAP